MSNPDFGSANIALWIISPGEKMAYRYGVYAGKKLRDIQVKVVQDKIKRGVYPAGSIVRLLPKEWIPLSI